MSDPLFAIARSGMDVERLRMEVIAQNLANVGSAAQSQSEMYRPQRLISGPQGGFANALERAVPTSSMSQPSGVRSYGLEPLDVPPRLVREPSHPWADDNGNVAYPGIDHPGEMALLVQTQRTFEANVVMYNAARAMFMRALELGGKP